MGITVYVDESGTHDETGALPGASIALLAGWVAHDDVWERFNKGWQAVLSKYKVPYFHFWDFSQASKIKRNPEIKVPSGYAKNPYRDMKLSDLNNFFDDCARMLDEPQLELVCSIFQKKIFHKDKETITHPIASMFLNDPYNYLVHDFFKRCLKQLHKKWGMLSDDITFIFDDTGDDEWRQRIRIVVAAYQQLGCRIKHLDFKSKLEALPIQAADMVGYRTNQIFHNLEKGMFADKMRFLDSIILKRVTPPLGWVSRVKP
jgi:hypothetical protein